ncbi:MAG: 3-oxoacyl-ACP synthase, partial [Fidelibacterota bacterium]
SEGKYAKELWSEVPASGRNPRISVQDVEEGKHWLQMNGREVFRHAVTRFPESIAEALEANSLKAEDVKLIIPHQANLRITMEVARRLNVPLETVYSNIDRYGNTTAASIPICLAEAVNENLIQPGDHIVLVAFGSGFTWASAMIKW